MNKNTLLNLKGASYFINILAYPYVSTWFTTAGPINKTIKNIDLNKHHQKTEERTWQMDNRCKEMEQYYTGNNCKRHLGQPYLLSNTEEVNITAYSMENKHGHHYITHLINCHFHHKGFNAVCKSTVNTAFLRLVKLRFKPIFSFSIY